MYLREWLIYLGTAARDLARRLGRSEAAIAVAISRGRLSPRLRAEIAQTLGLAPDDLDRPPQDFPAVNRAKVLLLAARRRLRAARSPAG